MLQVFRGFWSFRNLSQNFLYEFAKFSQIKSQICLKSAKFVYKNSPAPLLTSPSSIFNAFIVSMRNEKRIKLFFHFRFISSHSLSQNSNYINLTRRSKHVKYYTTKWRKRNKKKTLKLRADYDFMYVRCVMMFICFAIFSSKIISTREFTRPFDISHQNFFRSIFPSDEWKCFNYVFLSSSSFKLKTLIYFKTSRIVYI